MRIPPISSLVRGRNWIAEGSRRQKEFLKMTCSLDFTSSGSFTLQKRTRKDFISLYSPRKFP